MSTVEPDHGDPGWRHVVHDTRSLDCIDHAHAACLYGDVCRCTCHLPAATSEETR